MSEELKPWDSIDSGDLDSAEQFLADNPGNAAFFPRDAYTLANIAMHCIREVRATRAELAALKAGQGEAWKCSGCDATSGSSCNANGCFENERDAPPASADAVSVPGTIGGAEYLYREALKELREALEPEDWMGEVSMHAFIDGALSVYPPATSVIVPVDRLAHVESLLACPQLHTRNEYIKAAEELRALLARQEVKS